MIFDYVFWLLALILLFNALCFVVLLEIHKDKVTKKFYEDTKKLEKGLGMILVHNAEEEKQKEQFKKADELGQDLPMSLKDDYDV
jgi:hypothetical protein